MPPWVSAAIGSAPGAFVTIVVGRLLRELINTWNLQIISSAKSRIVVYKTKDEQWISVSPSQGEDQPSEGRIVDKAAAPECD
jgi:hypothetical protein